MKTPISKYDILFPQKNLLSALRDLTEGKFSNESFLRRAVVVEIDQVGGQLEQNPVKNPKNSIRARIISEPSPHTFFKNADLPVFWPLFPFDVLPLKETEHVYVVFETPNHVFCQCHFTSSLGHFLCSAFPCCRTAGPPYHPSVRPWLLDALTNVFTPSQDADTNSCNTAALLLATFYRLQGLGTVI